MLYFCFIIHQNKEDYRLNFYSFQHNKQRKESVMKTHEKTDNQLIRDYIEGNNASFEVLINRYSKKVFGYVMMIVNNRDIAEDIHQDTFLKVINTIKSGKYNEEGKFIQWVMRIAHNLSIDHFRRNNRMPMMDNNDDFDIFDVLYGQELSIEDRIVRDQIHTDVKTLLDYLPEEQREVMYMRHYQDMSFKDIAEQTNVSINTALGRMRYALINLRKIIAEKEIVLCS
jgi:RNA polymerase sigma factor (sigma-70 family)